MDRPDLGYADTDRNTRVSTRVAAALALLTLAGVAAGVWAVGYGLGWEHRP